MFCFATEFAFFARAHTMNIYIYLKHAKTSKICDVKQATAFVNYVADKNYQYIKYKAHVKVKKIPISILNSFIQKSD